MVEFRIYQIKENILNLANSGF